MVPLPRPPFLSAESTRALLGFTWSRTGPTRPLVPASAKVWHVPHDCVKICLPAALAVAAPPPPPPLPEDVLPPPPPLEVDAELLPPPPPVSWRLSPITIAGMVTPKMTMMSSVGIQNLRLNYFLPETAPRRADGGRGGGY